MAAYGPRTQNAYSPSAITLDGGLDFITPKVSVNGGTLSGCLNFERTDRVGYSRIYGYEPFNGGELWSGAYTNCIFLYWQSSDYYPMFRGDFIYLDNTLDSLDVQSNVIGIVADCTGNTSTSGPYTICVMVTNLNAWAKALQSGECYSTSHVFNLANDLIDQNSKFQSASDQLQYLNSLIPGNQDSNIDSKNSYALPGQVSGLHGYKDQIYAVVDIPWLQFVNGAVEVFPGDVLRPYWMYDDSLDVQVLDIQVESGSWDSGDATGKFLVADSSNAQYQTLAIVNPDGTVQETNALDAEDFDEATSANLYKSHTYWQAKDASLPTADNPYPGFYKVDQGYKTEFNNGTEYGPFHLSRRGKFSEYQSVVSTSENYAATGTTTDAVVTSGGSTWSIVGAADIPSALNSDTGLGKHVNHTLFTNGITSDGITPGHLDLSNFPAIASLAADDNITITGMSVEIRVNMATLPFSPGETPPSPTLLTQLTTGGTVIDAATTYTEAPSLSPPTNSVGGTYTYGGEQDTWGLSADDFKSALTDLGIRISPSMVIYDPSFGTNRTQFFFYSVKVTVYFTAKITAYYFWNGTDDVVADIVSYFTTDGDWPTNDAQGILQLTNMHAYGSGTRRSVRNGDEIRTSPEGGGLLVANVSADLSNNGLDTLADIEQAKSRYEFITANFYGDADSEAFYGASGAGRAFSYDGVFFSRIYTQEDDSKDIPRHIAEHQFHLVLGYPSGAAVLSVTGDPLTFSGVNGAAEIDTGDPIMGFCKMQGTTLGIFCQKTVQGLVGTSIDNFSLNVLSPYEGAIEYTIVDIGKPVYCSYRGISFFDQTSAYGDFAGQRLSYQITPWLLPRLQGIKAAPLFAVPWRTSNQYRLYFSDGYRLTMTLVGSDQTPIFTLQQITDSHSESSGCCCGGTYNTVRNVVIPRAYSSFVDSSGTEHLHIVHDEDYYGGSVVWEYEKCWSFSGSGIPSYIISNENFFNSPLDYDNLRKLRLHGLSLGIAHVNARLDKDYAANTALTSTPREAVDVSLPREGSRLLYQEYVPSTSMGALATRGRSFSFRMMSYNLDNPNSSEPSPSYSPYIVNPLSAPEPYNAPVYPPFVLQAMLAQFTENKGDI